MKSNYGPVGETVTVRWKAGLFLPEPTAGSLERLAADQRAEDMFLNLLDRFNAQERTLSQKFGGNYAPTLFAREPEAKAARINKAALDGAMTRLFAANKIHLEQYGPPSRDTFKLMRGGKQ